MITIRFIVGITFFHTVLYSFSAVYFTPRDDLKALLIQYIQEEKKSIDCAIYMLTEKTIAQEILNAHLQGIKVRVVLDPISVNSNYGKGLFLKNNGVFICTYRPAFTSSFLEPIMHHKFIIFGKNSRLNRSLVWTGSYNFTSSASRLHEENVIITDEVTVVQEYKKCFDMLLARFN